MTSGQLCDLIEKEHGYHLSVSTYNEMERDVQKNYGYLAFVYLAKYYNVSTDYLMGLSEESKVSDIREISDYTGLSIDRIDYLHKLAKERNEAEWYFDILNSVMNSKDFEAIVYYLTQLAENNFSEKAIDGLVYPINSREILEKLMDKHYKNMVSSILNEYSIIKDKDFSMACSLLYSRYHKGIITDEELRKTLIEFKKGNYEYDPRGGADNGKHQGKQE